MIKKGICILVVLPLYEDALDDISGYADISDVFNVTQEEVDEFDKSFSPKEKNIKQVKMSMKLRFLC